MHASLLSPWRRCGTLALGYLSRLERVSIADTDAESLGLANGDADGYADAVVIFDAESKCQPMDAKHDCVANSLAVRDAFRDCLAVRDALAYGLPRPTSARQH